MSDASAPAPQPAADVAGTPATHKRVAIIGSGNWGSTIAKIVGENLNRKASLPAMGFVPAVEMYVYEERLPDGTNLTDAINKYHQNTKYLPGVLLPDNIHATPDVAEAMQNATHVLMVSPHQFVGELCKQIAAAVTPEQRDRMGVLNLSKGFFWDRDARQLLRISQVAQRALGLGVERVGALSGPNVAKEVAAGHFTESTLAIGDVEMRREFAELFRRPEFAVRESTDVVGIELGGALKNIVALAAGMIDGLGLGNNAKATVIRLGMVEMMRFGALDVFQDKPRRITVATPAWIGDALTTCYGGRNRLYGEALGRCFRDGFPPVRIDDFRNRALGGQVVEGYSTTLDVIAFLAAHGKVTEFPLFHSVYEAITMGKDPRERFVEILNSVES